MELKEGDLTEFPPEFLLLQVDIEDRLLLDVEGDLLNQDGGGLLDLDIEDGTCLGLSSLFRQK